MIGALLSLLVQATAPAPPAAPFLSGRFECRIVDTDTKVSTLVFDYAPGSITIVEGASLSRNGASAKAKSTLAQVGPIRIRHTEFQDSSSGTVYDLSEMAGTNYRANRLTILTERGGLQDIGGGKVAAMSQLTATGMCKAAPHGALG